MATPRKTGPASASAGELTDIHTTARNPIGMRVPGLDAVGASAEFIYLKGVASTIAGSVVVFDEVGVTALISANAKGCVAVAMAAIDANTKFGWYCIQGTVLVDMAANTADNSTLGRETQDGRVGDGRAAGDEISNMFARGATGGAAALTLAQFDHPYVNDFLGA